MFGKYFLELISNFSNKVENFDNFHVNENYLKFIYDIIEYTELYYTNNGESITSILKKKHWFFYNLN